MIVIFLLWLYNLTIYFINHTLTIKNTMTKNQFHIKLITKNECKNILQKYHYLSNISKGFKSGYNYGLILDDKIVGLSIFTSFPVPELVVGMLGLDRNNQQGLFELSRLCLIPEVQKSEYNITSWFLSRAIKQFKKDTNVRLILSYADSSFHNGTIYQACNFKYYGLSDNKKDFWIKQDDGTYIKHSRGKTKGIQGEWRPRTQKHRFLMTFDKTLNIRWKQHNFIKTVDTV